MHGHTPGTNTVLLITKMIGFVADEKFSQVSILAHSIIHLYAYLNMSVIRLVVITEVI